MNILKLQMIYEKNGLELKLTELKKKNFKKLPKLQEAIIELLQSANSHNKAKVNNSK